MNVVSESRHGAGAASAADISELSVQGMNCQGCVRNVRDALQSIPGVANADVKLEEGRASVRWRAGFTPAAATLVEAVRKAGYQAENLPSNATADAPKPQALMGGWKFNVILGTIATLPLMVSEWIFGLGMERWYHWIAFALVSPVQFLCGARFYRGAWNQLKAGNSNMDTLVALGSTTAYAYSVWALLAGWHGHLFFMESGSIITLISLGHWIESLVSARAESSLRALLHLAPQMARLLSKSGEESEVAVLQLRLGDTVIVKPGDRIPTDGEVLEGFSAVDESMLTGESMPVEKGKGAKLYAGTVNGAWQTGVPISPVAEMRSGAQSGAPATSGLLLMRVTATGETTALAHIIEVVRRAQTSRANIQKLGDRVSSVFVPLVILVAIGTGLWWGLAPESARVVSQWMESLLWPAHHPAGPLATAIYHAAAVLIIACPCAMGLATPVAIMAGANVGSARGILIRDGLAIEKTSRLSAILFDKTGTLTEGRLSVAAVEDYPGELSAGAASRELAASLAKPSQHPLSVAIAALSNSTVPILEWQEIRGAGVQAMLSADPSASTGRVVRLGSLVWLNELGVDLSSGVEFSRAWSAKGATILGLAMDRRLLAQFALQDTVKSNAAEVTAELKRRGLSVFLVTGDHQLTAAAIALQAGIDDANVYAEVKPERKGAIVMELQNRGQHVAFVGDGINDAPALEQADLGIAVSQASDVAKEAADMILLRSNLQAIPEAIDLAQATLRTIRQNLFWAFFYNAAAVPLAVFGFVSPIISALAMGFSDLMVIGNALRLRWLGPSMRRN
ncbi:MAG: cation-translocating P-type ATPase [Verrucomicrobia bacterium]|nr:cation-translocating P-type ATPase [Verrucomicrobiota bacterium]